MNTCSKFVFQTSLDLGETVDPFMSANYGQYKLCDIKIPMIHLIDLS